MSTPSVVTVSVHWESELVSLIISVQNHRGILKRNLDFFNDFFIDLFCSLDNAQFERASSFKHPVYDTTH